MKGAVGILSKNTSLAGTKTARAGYALIDQMIVVAMVGISAAVAYSFTSTFDFRGSMRRQNETAQMSQALLVAEAERIRATPYSKLLAEAENKPIDKEMLAPGIRIRRVVSVVEPGLVYVRLAALWEARGQHYEIEIVTMRGDYGW